VVQLQRAAYAIEAELIGFDGIPPMHETIEDVLAFDFTWLGAFASDDMVGGLGYRDEPEGRNIDRLFVAPAHSRMGIRRRLVEATLAVPPVMVSTGTANTPAVALYEGLGFERTGDR